MDVSSVLHVYAKGNYYHAHSTKIRKNKTSVKDLKLLFEYGRENAWKIFSVVS